MKDHEIRELVNQLRDVALMYRDAQQLRSRIQDLILPLARSCASWTPARADDVPDHGETVLRVQGLLGITQTGWVSPDVIELRIEHLKKAAHAQQDAAPSDAWTAASQPPDADITVMLAMTDGEVWQGYWNGTDWIEVSGLMVTGRVKYWQHTPKHPEDRA